MKITACDNSWLSLDQISNVVSFDGERNQDMMRDFPLIQLNPAIA